MEGRQRDVWKEIVYQEKSVACRTVDSNPFLWGATHLKPEEVKVVLRVQASQLPTRAYLKKITSRRYHAATTARLTLKPSFIFLIIAHTT